MKLTEDEKEYLLALLEWRIADHDGLRELKKLRISRSLFVKIEKENTEKKGF